MSNSSTDNNLRIERIMGNATEMESSSLQEPPESPPGNLLFCFSLLYKMHIL